MRKLLWGFALALTASIVILACQKEVSSPEKPDTAFDDKAAKEWFYGSFKKSTEYAGYNTATRGKKLPDWQKAKSKIFGKYLVIDFPLVKQKTAVTFPENSSLTDAEKGRVAEASVSRVAFIKSSTSKIDVREIQFIPDMDYLVRHNYDISNNSFASIDKDFSGFLVVKNWAGVELSRSVISDGKISKRLKKYNSSRGNRGNSTETIICIIEWARDCGWEQVGDNGQTWECGEWYETGNQICFDDNEGPEEDPCADPNSPQCNDCILYGLCEDPGGGDEGLCQQNAESIFATASVLAEKESSNDCGSSGNTRYKCYTWKVYTVSNGMIPMYLKSNDKATQVKGGDNIWRFTSLIHENIAKSGTEILYSVSVEDVTATPTLSSHLGTSNQVGQMHLGFKVKVSVICDGLPIVHNDPTTTSTSWHVSE